MRRRWALPRWYIWRAQGSENPTPPERPVLLTFPLPITTTLLSHSPTQLTHHYPPAQQCRGATMTAVSTRKTSSVCSACAYHSSTSLHVDTNLPTAPGAGPSHSQPHANKAHGGSDLTDESVSPKLSPRHSTHHSLFCTPRMRTLTFAGRGGLLCNRGLAPTSPTADTRALMCHSHIPRSLLGPTSRFQLPSHHTRPHRPPTGTTATTSQRIHGCSRFQSPPYTCTRMPNATSPPRIF